MIDAREQLVTLTEARSQYIPRSGNGKAVNPSTLWRWIRQGLKGLDGERIRLEVLYRGSTPMTSPEAIRRFFDSVTEARLARTLDDHDHVTDDELSAAGLK